MLSLQMPWVLPQGIFSCSDCCSQYRISVGVPPVKIYSPFIDAFCWYSAAPVWEEGRQRDDGADVVLCLTLCRRSSSRFGGELHHSLCGLLSLATGAVQGGGSFLAWGKVSEAFHFQGLRAGALGHGADHQPLGLAAFVCQEAIAPPAPPQAPQ